MENAWWYAGGIAIFSSLAALWGPIRNFIMQTLSRVVITIEVYSCPAEAVMCYCWQKLKRSPFGKRNYTGWLFHVRPLRRRQLVAMEGIGQGSVLFWKGWRPVWITQSRKKSSSEAPVHVGSEFAGTLSITFFRGTIDPDQFIIDAVELYNAVESGMYATQGEFAHKRHRIHYIHGTAGRMMVQNIGAEETGPHTSRGPTEGNNVRGTIQHRILQWTRDDLGTPISDMNALSTLALAPEAMQIVKDVRKWKASEEFYRERGLPWRLSWLLYGLTGTGKTSTVRAIAEEYDLPVYVYDLTTLHNDEFRKEWSTMLIEVPCIALIEDIDATFKGRDNIRDEGITFDCLLNCLDGVERADGVLTFVTTNDTSHLDPALAAVSKDGVVSRPGRIDRAVEFRELSAEGRLQIVQRIMPDHPNHWEKVVKEGEGETGAQFQHRCGSFALKEHWVTERTGADDAR